MKKRDIFWRPERLKYVRKIIKPKGCVFCQALKAKESECAELGVLYKSKNAMVILNKYPYNTGHLLILPRVHEGEVENLTDKAWYEIHWLLKESIKIIKKNYTCSGLNVGMNLGAVAGAGIPDHLHYHVIPRWFGDTNFFPLIAETKIVVETPDQTYKKLSASFLKLQGKFK